jgi:hypothetical protein
MIRALRSTSRYQRHSHFAAFDILTAASEGHQDWSSHRPLGIACAAVWTTGARRPSLWYGVQPGRQSPTPQMQRGQLRRLVNYLEELISRRYTLVTWNGTGFDWNVLASESGERETCRQLARRHVDMMLQVVCARGHRLSLQKAARQMGVAKHAGSWNPEAKWAAGQYRDVLDQLSHDVRVTLDLAHACQERRRLEWISKAGRSTSMPLPHGWLSVREALNLPVPDVSGLQNPASRTALTDWLN